jgi:LPS-assembly protein
MAFADLSWPWVKSASGGHSAQVIEPVVQMIWSQESTTGMRSRTKIQHARRVRRGQPLQLRRASPEPMSMKAACSANVGVTWTRYDPAGWNLGLTLGRVLRHEDYGQFGPASGLGGTRNSDWLAALTMSWQNGFAATGRVVFDDDFEASKAELRLTLNRERLALSTSALYAVADPSENRPEATSEFTVDALWKVNPALSAG